MKNVIYIIDFGQNARQSVESGLIGYYIRVYWLAIRGLWLYMVNMPVWGLVTTNIQGLWMDGEYLNIGVYRHFGACDMPVWGLFKGFRKFLGLMGLLACDTGLSVLRGV